MDQPDSYIAFDGWRRVASGNLTELLCGTCAYLGSARTDTPVLIFHDQTGKQVDFDLRGGIDEILARVAVDSPRLPEKPGPGRPRLGVVSREISLLPRHWDWLETQSGGASAMLRRLVDEARKKTSPEESTQRVIEAAGRVMSALAGNLPGFEEAYRALYARDREKLEDYIKVWPEDVRNYVTNRLDSVPPGA